MKLYEKNPSRTWQILTVMRILAWVAFIGFLIQGGAILISCAVSYINPDAAKNLYRGLNLYNLREFSFWHYNLYVSFLVALPFMKARVAILVVKLISKLNLQTPFTMQVANRLERISYILFGTWFITMLSNLQVTWLMSLTHELNVNFASGEFIFMAGVVFVFSQIFKRGVEIQSENELTV